MHVRERNRETSRQRQRKEKRTKEKQIEKEKIGRKRERKGERERERKRELINKILNILMHAFCVHGVRLHINHLNLSVHQFTYIHISILLSLWLSLLVLKGNASWKMNPAPYFADLLQSFSFHSCMLSLFYNKNFMCDFFLYYEKQLATRS